MVNAKIRIPFGIVLNWRGTDGPRIFETPAVISVILFFVQLNESRMPLSTCKDEIYGFDALIDWLIWLLVKSQMETSAFPGDARGVHLPGPAS